jgi:hypothetical protein
LFRLPKFSTSRSSVVFSASGVRGAAGGVSGSSSDLGRGRQAQRPRDPRRSEAHPLFLAQGWTQDQLDRKVRAEGGECVVANMRQRTNGRREDEALLAWVEASDRFERIERIDRKTEWGNPFEMPGDGWVEGHPRRPVDAPRGYPDSTRAKILISGPVNLATVEF